jgi:hypothetical protein
MNIFRGHTANNLRYSAWPEVEEQGRLYVHVLVKQNFHLISTDADYFRSKKPN